jgi:hypothetical protein
MLPGDHAQVQVRRPGCRASWNRRIRQRDAMLASHDLVKVSPVESAVRLAVQPQHALHLGQRDFPLRRSVPPVKQAVVAPRFVPLTAAPQLRAEMPRMSAALNQ